MTDSPLIPVVDLDLSGRTAIVTGGVSGIGLACARRFAAAGAAVTVLDLDADAARSTAESLEGPAESRGVGADLSDPQVLAGLDESADIILNNAGFQRVSPIEEFEPDVFVAIQRVMVEAPFRLIRASLPRMYEQGWGRIINISSAHGLIASPYKVAYVTAKHGLEGMSKVVAVEGGPKGVTSNCINPAYVRTPLVEKQIADQAKVHGLTEDEVVTKIMLTRTAIKRLIEPSEVAEMAAYLCTPQASFVTGAALRMDGGWTAS